MRKEHVPLVGTYVITSDLKGKVSFESIVRNTLRECGYPCISCGDPCSPNGSIPNPDLCAMLDSLGCLGGGGSNPITVLDTQSINLTLASDVLSAAVILNPTSNLLQSTAQGLLLTCEQIQDCVGTAFGSGDGLTYNDSTNTLNAKLSADAGNCLSFGTDKGLFYSCAGGVETLNGISGDGATGSEVVLGGTLDRNTTIDVGSTYTLSLTKDNVKFEMVNSAAPSGAGESVRMYGTNGTTVADMGVYTSGPGVPNASIRTGTSAVYYNTRFLPAIDTLISEAGEVAKAYKFVSELGTRRAHFGISDGNLIYGVIVDDTSVGSGGTGTILLKGLTPYANNAAAVSGGLPVDALYKTATGELRIVV